MNYVELLLNLQIYLKDNITYADKVTIGKYHPTNFPPFDKYCILISPAWKETRSIANRTKETTCGIDIVCIVRNYHSAMSIIGQLAPEIGYLKMVDDVTGTLLEFGKVNESDLLILYNETDRRIDFKTNKQPEREDFYHEIVLPYQVKLKPVTIQI
jgi:hypothetical protein